MEEPNTLLTHKIPEIRAIMSFLVQKEAHIYNFTQSYRKINIHLKRGRIKIHYSNDIEGFCFYKYFLKTRKFGEYSPSNINNEPLYKKIIVDYFDSQETVDSKIKEVKDEILQII